jgi:hypothetical protein
LSKEEYPKEKTPGRRSFPALLAFGGGCRKGLPAPSPTCGIHAAPLRAIPAKSSGARRGIRDKTVAVSKADNRFCRLDCRMPPTLGGASFVIDALHFVQHILRAVLFSLRFLSPCKWKREFELNFLFWNVCKKNIESEIAELVDSTSANILILAEYVGENKAILQALHGKGKDFFAVPIIACGRLRIFTDFSPHSIKHLGETSIYTIKELRLKGQNPILLGLAHLPSKLHASELDQLHEAQLFKQEIEKSEREVGHQNTLVIGDFNMNPFEPGMIAANGLHSVPCLKIAKSKPKTIRDRSYTFFYNPMWNLMGDYDGVPGSYFYRDSSYLTYYWNLLDQVILRPNIAHYLVSSSLKILTNTGTTKLLNSKGKPKVSDHLPLFFSLSAIV